MPKVKDIYDFICEIAPVELAMDNDNVGLLAGRSDREVSKILLALDITGAVIDEAAEMGAQLIISHHPMFMSVTRITDDTFDGQNIIGLLENKMSAICMHTNLDAVAGGINDVLVAKMGFTEKAEAYGDVKVDRLGRKYGLLRSIELKEPRNVEDVALMIKKNLGIDCVRVTDAGRPVKRIAIGSGAAGVWFDMVRDDGMDTYITAEIRHSTLLEARQMGVNVIDAGHFATEDIIIETLINAIHKQFPGVKAVKSKRHTDPVRFI